MTYQNHLKMIIGSRSIGKTFSFKKKGLIDFKKKGVPFIYLRRTETEINEIDKEKFFNDELLRQSFEGFKLLNREVTSARTVVEFESSESGFEHVKMIIQSGRITINGRVVCYLKALSTWYKIKSSEYDDVEMMMFDECLIDKASRKQNSYLANEVEYLISLLSSIFRLRTNWVVYMLGNMSSWNNPYFAYFEIEDVEGHKEFINRPNLDFVIQFCKEIVYTEESNNPIFKIARKSKSFSASILNQRDENEITNIGTPKGNKVLNYMLYLDGEYILCYGSTEGLFFRRGYVSDVLTVSFDKMDSEKGYYYVNRTSNIGSALRRAFYGNRLVYEDYAVKRLFLNEALSIL